MTLTILDLTRIDPADADRETGGPIWITTKDGERVREYLAYYDRPAYPSKGPRFNAYPTFNEPWEHIRDMLPPTVLMYRLIWAPTKPQAVCVMQEIAKVS